MTALLLCLLASVKVEAERITGFYERNDSLHVAQAESYLVFKDRATFEKVFHPAATKRPVRQLTDDDFKTKIIVAVVKRGNSPVGFRIESVEGAEGKGVADYKATAGKQSTTTQYRNVLLFSIPKDGVKSVELRENGKTVHTLEIEKEPANK